MLNKQLGDKLDISFEEFLSPGGAQRVDEAFVCYLKERNEELAKQMLNYRENAHIKWSAKELSLWLVDLAPFLDDFIGDLFDIDSQIAKLKAIRLADRPIFAFKQYFVLRLAKRRLKDKGLFASFDKLNEELRARLLVEESDDAEDFELFLAKRANALLEDDSAESKALQELIVQWCVQALSSEQGQKFTENWVAFNLPKRINFNELIDCLEQEDELGAWQKTSALWRERDGFALTDKRMSPREVAGEVDYCVYCHQREDDFCRKGFPAKKSEPELGFKVNSLEDDLTGCPLEEKISEMQWLKKEGWAIGALATMMIDNPMCPLTGHRICNDCMKACIYQKQDPVDIPQVETGILTDVLSLPWGVEIYHLLVRWNPLRQQQWVEKPYQGYKNLVVGLGPAGITLAHHLLMEGVAVVAVDGLKVESMRKSWLEKPVHYFADMCSSLEDRINRGFGGVAEYGITARWDKNFLQLVYMSMLRRQHFQVYGGVRLGGTLEVADVWRLGFHHLSICVGAGLPRELSIENSLAPGMRSANDFLMTLQSTNAYQKSSLAHIQVRLPAVVIGGGLTAIDTATELQAYYVRQVEKVAYRYHVLSESMGQKVLRRHFMEDELALIDEMLAHAQAIANEKSKAQEEEREPELIPLIHSWGGVSVVYRRSMQHSPAYQRNYQEINKALEEGILYLENLQPTKVRIDGEGQVSGLLCEERFENENGQWVVSDKEVSLPAKSIMVATGAQPNIAYEYEHRGTFTRGQRSYEPHIVNEHGQLSASTEQGHCKTQPLGVLTNYQGENQHRVSFLGDTHPLFHGSVVKAMASAKEAYPKIIAAMPKLPAIADLKMDYFIFHAAMHARFTTQVVSLRRLTAKTYELIIRAPQACFKHCPGQFYRLQSYVRKSKVVADTRLTFGPIAAMGIPVEDQPGCLSFAIQHEDMSLNLLKRVLSKGKPIALMGPTGSASHIPENKTVVIVGGVLAIPYVLSLSKALKEKGNKLIFIGLFPKEQRLFWQVKLEPAVDFIVYSVERGPAILTTAEQAVSFSSAKKTLAGQLEESLAELNKQYDRTTIDEVHVIGGSDLLQHFKKLDKATFFNESTRCIASVYGPMQCMLKGVCAQCLQWQVDPITGERTKAVYACSWQHQPMGQIDIHHLEQRFNADKTQRQLNRLWTSHILSQAQ